MSSSIGSISSDKYRLDAWGFEIADEEQVNLILQIAINGQSHRFAVLLPEAHLTRWQQIEVESLLKAIRCNLSVLSLSNLKTFSGINDADKSELVAFIAEEFRNKTKEAYEQKANEVKEDQVVSLGGLVEVEVSEDTDTDEETAPLVGDTRTKDTRESPTDTNVNEWDDLKLSAAKKPKLVGGAENKVKFNMLRHDEQSYVRLKDAEDRSQPKTKTYAAYAEENIAILEAARGFVEIIRKQAEEEKNPAKEQECDDYLANIKQFLAVEYKTLAFYLEPLDRQQSADYYKKARELFPNIAEIPEVSEFQIFRFKNGLETTRKMISGQIEELLRYEFTQTFNS